jgi:hypothetical protein
MHSGLHSQGRQVLAGLLRIGWTIKRETGPHKVPSRPRWRDVVFRIHVMLLLQFAPWTRGVD